MGYDPKTLRGEVPFFRVEMDDDLYEDCVLRDDHIALVEAKDAEIARLTAAVHELESTVTETEGRAQGAIAQVRAERDAALVRAERSERAERAAHDAANTAIKQRDEARALLAILYGKEGMGNVTPADASTALAARDAAMRNEGRRRVKVRPLVWEDFDGQGAKASGFYHANYLVTLWRGRGRGLFEVSVSYPRSQARFDGKPWYSTMESAKAAAQADYEARILAALEPEGGE